MPTRARDIREHNDIMSTASDAPKQLQDALDNAKLHIFNTRTQLKAYNFENLDDSTSGEGALSDPAVVASDVAAQIVRVPYLGHL